jgi:excinuclease ABC subunit C
MIEHLKEKIDLAPRKTGVYLMKDKEGRIIYVGKAKNLKSRIRSYFQGTDSRYMVPFLVSRVHDLDLILTNTEKEALILENNLIKEHRPRYNVYFRDDKSYFNIRIDETDHFPWFQLIRRPKKDGATYFGPYPSSVSAKDTLHFLQQIFPLRTCKSNEFRRRRRPCIEYEIKRCLAPCCDRIGAEEYRGLVRDVIAFLEGRTGKLVSDLKARMARASEEMNFEEAARIRDRIAAVEETLEKQRIVSMAFKDQDVFGYWREDDLIQICVLHVRDGKILGHKKFPLFRSVLDSSEILSSSLKQYYDEELFIPGEILVSEPLEDMETIQEWLTERKKKKVLLIRPFKGERKGLIRIAEKNAENIFKTDRSVEAETARTLSALRDILHLRKLPGRIECFDISTLGGQSAVGSMVTFTDGRPDKTGYRHFRIKHVKGMDDYGMMLEVLGRRYRQKENLPDLVMLDGGKGQLRMAVSVFHEQGIQDLDIIALAKKADLDTGEKVTALHGRKGIRKGEDRVYLPGRKDPVYLTKYPASLFLLQRIRDEAHRFAVSYHRKLMEKRDLRSILDDFPGVSQARRSALLAYFGDIGRMKEASKKDLQEVQGIGAKMAVKIQNYLRALSNPER